MVGVIYVNMIVFGSVYEKGGRVCVVFVLVIYLCNKFSGWLWLGCIVCSGWWFGWVDLVFCVAGLGLGVICVWCVV